MKIKIFSVIIALTLLSCAYSLRIKKYPLLYNQKVPSGSLTVNVSNCKNSHGTVKICIYNTLKTYVLQRFPFRERSSLIKNQSASFKFKYLPHGDYAIITFHDRNQNSKLDYDALGMPKERYGYSNNLDVFYGRAGYGAAKFHFSGEAITLDIIQK